MDFKAQIEEDMAVFNNASEFATVTKLWYRSNEYEVPVIIDHETARERTRLIEDHAEGIDQIETIIYISFADLGIVPEKGCNIEIEEAGATRLYKITKSYYEDGEIILELGAFDE